MMEIIKETVSSFNILGEGMEIRCVSENVLHSLFLQLTGAQEQKMKCICWDIACNDFRFRSEHFFQNWSFGECSSLTSKNKVFKELAEELKGATGKYYIFSSPDKHASFLRNVTEQFCHIMDGSNLANIYKPKYDEFHQTIKDIYELKAKINPSKKEAKSKIIETIKSENFKNKMDFMEKGYELLYNHRNRCAHNLLSYQCNTPSLEELANTQEQQYNNIFLFMFILILFDELFMKVYKDYLHHLEMSSN
jgi:hypothetical protein